MAKLILNPLELEQRYRKKNDIQYEFMYFHYINDQKKYETKTISEKKFLNYYAVKNDIHDVKGTASDLSPPVPDRPLVPILSSEAAARGCDVH